MDKTPCAYCGNLLAPGTFCACIMSSTAAGRARNAGQPASQADLLTDPFHHEVSPSREFLRDWFAGQALTGLLCVWEWPENVAEMAYELADAMLEARKK